MSFLYAFALMAIAASQEACLGDDVYAVRQSASAVMTACLPASEPLLLALAKSEDAEVRHRARRILHIAAVRRAEAVLPTAYPVLPWIDSWPVGVERPACLTEYYSYVEAARQELGGGRVGLWPEFRLATRYWVRHMLIDEGWDVTRVRELLDQMVVWEKVHMAEKKYALPVAAR